MRRRRVPPGFMPTTPSSQPGITWCWPSATEKCCPLRSYELSNFLHVLASQPVYSTDTVLFCLAAVPLPVSISIYLSPPCKVTTLPVMRGAVAGPAVGVAALAYILFVGVPAGETKQSVVIVVAVAASAAMLVAVALAELLALIWVVIRWYCQ